MSIGITISFTLPIIVDNSASERKLRTDELQEQQQGCIVTKSISYTLQITTGSLLVSMFSNSVNTLGVPGNVITNNTLLPQILLLGKSNQIIKNNRV